MLIRTKTLERIKAGEITLAFRSWARPTVRTGGQLRTAIGVLDIVEVRTVSPSDLTESDAAQAGYLSLQALLRKLAVQPDRPVYQIALRFAGPDGRQTLAQDDDVSEAECGLILTQLRKIDRRIDQDGWSRSVLGLIADFPGLAAQDLAERMQEEKLAFKSRVRKLKEIGLTEGLKFGYRFRHAGR